MSSLISNFELRMTIIKKRHVDPLFLGLDPLWQVYFEVLICLFDYLLMRFRFDLIHLLSNKSFIFICLCFLHSFFEFSSFDFIYLNKKFRNHFFELIKGEIVIVLRHTFEDLRNLQFWDGDKKINAKTD